MRNKLLPVLALPAALVLSSCVVETGGPGGYPPFPTAGYPPVPPHSYTGDRARVHERAYHLGRKDAHQGLTLQSSRHSSEYSQADRVSFAKSYQDGYYSVPASERGRNRYEGGGNQYDSGNHYREPDYRGGQNYGGTSMEYKRGYNDGLKGYAYDQDRHPQDYKDGYRAGESARTGR